MCYNGAKHDDAITVSFQTFEMQCFFAILHLLAITKEKVRDTFVNEFCLSIIRDKNGYNTNSKGNTHENQYRNIMKPRYQCKMFFVA